ncbi:hypothetical protein GT360_12425 [Vibrio astriarenae]|uniref:Restriction endonuclease type IV Mrr domain-containing protein n=1 Tax=Vibrio astriarenae TaxID=1481923 RepID=A0A7Z2YEM6_9VIBR|nr:restriction endonuclease [Vibrio astriarenae]QIA64265.1 hypothetical protein GT360_12425 [Vibrio astriarenae]
MTINGLVLFYVNGKYHQRLGRDAINWKQYQESVAHFFKELGLDTEIEAIVHGVRGKHEVDVLVKGNIQGIQFTWVIECKNWKKSIPKEKVMALSSIVQDIGADRGFLLSESGFQSGAIKATAKSNITLTSLQELEEDAKQGLLDSTLGSISWRITKAQTQLRTINKEIFDAPYIPPPEILDLMSSLLILSSVLEDAMKDEYPINYYRNDTVYSQKELIERANKVLNKAEAWILDTLKQ